MDPRFVPNPVTPDLFRDFTISFPGGSIKATKDVLLSMFADPSSLDTCAPDETAITRAAHSRQLWPGGPTTQVGSTSYTKKNYSNGGTSRAAGGEPIKVLINGTYWTARLTGSHQDFMDYLCDNRDALAEGFSYWKSQKGKPYAVSSATSTES